MEQAKCVGMAPNKRLHPEEPDPFFPEKGQDPNVGRMVCVECPVRRECKEYMEATNSSEGIWAGQFRKGSRDK